MIGPRPPQSISRSITPETPRFTNGPGNSLAMTFAFRETEDGRPAMNTGASGFGRLNADQIAAALYAIQQWQDVANIALTRVQDPGSQYSNNAQFTFWNYTNATSGSGPASASGYGGSTNSSGSWQNYVYLNEAKTLATAPTNANGGLEFYMHEIGHALGLSHPGPYNIGGTGTYTAYARDAVFYEDSEQYTLMSYFSANITHAAYGTASAATPLLYDVAAIQRLYGANMTTRTGDNIYGFNANAARPFPLQARISKSSFPSGMPVAAMCLIFPAMMKRNGSTLMRKPSPQSAGCATISPSPGM
jgi:serralysin